MRSSSARTQGHTWQEIGDVLGTSRQAAFQRFGRPVDPRTGEEHGQGPPGAAEKCGRCCSPTWWRGRWTEVRRDFDERMAAAAEHRGDHRGVDAGASARSAPTSGWASRSRCGSASTPWSTCRCTARRASSPAAWPSTATARSPACSSSRLTERPTEEDTVRRLMLVFVLLALRRAVGPRGSGHQSNRTTTRAGCWTISQRLPVDRARTARAHRRLDSRRDRRRGAGSTTLLAERSAS